MNNDNRETNVTVEIVDNTYYNVSGGPIISTSHLYMSLSSIRPAEKPSTGFLFNSEKQKEIC